MDKLRKVFFNQQPGQKSVVIWGFGGLGKTRLALQYLSLYQCRYSAILWLNGSSPERVAESFTQAATNIKARDKAAQKPTGTKNDMAIVHHWLKRVQAKSNWLLVIDSVEDVEQLEVRRLIPQCPHGDIIITSTLSQISTHLECESVELGSIDCLAGAEMLLSGTVLRYDIKSRMHSSSASIVRY